MPKELKPCPFCGGEAVYEVKSGMAFVKCRNWIKCGAVGPMVNVSDEYIAKDIAIEKWERRSQTESSEDDTVHAYWNKDPATGFTNCSNCKAPPPGDADLEKFYESDFCPCCGAVMDKKPIPSTSTG